jgi:glycyl-tRNA synthetase beta chain
MENLLLEIGSEEIPAGYIEPALEAMAALLSKRLTGARISHGKRRIFGTPRRLAVIVEDVAAKQTALSTEVIGPPQKVSFDAQGKPTMAAVKFAEKVGVTLNDLHTQDTPKGSYLCAVKKEKGLTTRPLLKTILPEVILAIPFPKNMRWSDLTMEFVRPIQSILALYGPNIVSFKLGNIKSGRYTLGHRFMHPAKLKISRPEDYVETLRSAYVMVNIAERKSVVEKEIAKAAGDVGGAILVDKALVDTVTNLVEYPAVAVGNFERDFLELPGEVLITAMREHQKYFAVVDGANNLMPFFIAVNNTPVKDMQVVATGHERVLRARLEDAKFFYTTDLDVSLDRQVDKLKNVLFQAQLGSVYDKTVRIEKNAEFIAGKVEYDSGLVEQVRRAAQLCKADLVTHMVGEFPKLQGIMGRVYARAQGELPTIATAIEEHYRPIYSGAPLPDTIAGAVLGIADKIDSICGCFRSGLIPTGAADPYALRRQGIGIVQIMLDKDFSFSLSELIENSLGLFDQPETHSLDNISEKIEAFLKNRMTHLLGEEGFSKDTVAAVVAVSNNSVPDIWNRVRALEKLKANPDFEPLAVAFKRVVNIIKRADDFQLSAIDEKLFEHDSESALWTAYGRVKRKIDDDLEKGLFESALAILATLRDDVDAFFDGVMVMVDNEKVRRNRLSMLGHIAALFENFADFSRIGI